MCIYKSVFITPPPRNVEQFETAAARIEDLVTAVRGVAADLQTAAQLELVTSENDQDDVTLVTMTQSHVTKMIPALYEPTWAMTRC